MSSANVNHSTENRQVMVRAFRNEPVKLSAIRTEGDRIEVYGSDPETTILFPSTSVFRFDERLFQRLHSAYIAHDDARLTKLWAEAERYESAEMTA